MSLQAAPVFNRRYRRSSDPMIAVWCLLDHVRGRYCLESAVIIDDFGRELVSVGDAWHLPPERADDGEALEQRHQSTALPGRKFPGLIVLRGPSSVLRAAFEDVHRGLERIFFGEESEDRDEELAQKVEALRGAARYIHEQ